MPTDDENVVIGNVSDKGRYLIRGTDTPFKIIDIIRTVTRHNCCAEAAIKCSTYYYQIDFLFAVCWF